MKVIPVDCNYVQAGFAASYLLVHEGKGFFIECNTQHAIPRLLAAAQSEGLLATDVEGMLITHVHLDHAGGAGGFLKVFPNARMYAHPKAARHAIDPSKLIKSATEVYGETFMKEQYGEILPCPKERVQILENQDSIFFCGLEIKTFHTRGHANHHLVAYEPESGIVFTGDACGVSYPAVNRDRLPVVLPSTSPTDFDGVEALLTLDQIERLDSEFLALTHFGFLSRDHHPAIFQMLRDQIRHSMEVVEALRVQPKDSPEVAKDLEQWTKTYFEQTWSRVLTPANLEILKVDLKINAQGLVFAARLAAERGTS